MPIKGKIDGELGGTAVFKWKVNKGPTDMLVISLILNRGATVDFKAALFTGTGKSPEAVAGQNVDRLNVTILGTVTEVTEVTYQVTLKNLQFNDTNSAFFLRGVFQSKVNGSIANPPGASITLIKVKGIYFFLLIFAFCLLVFLT